MKSYSVTVSDDVVLDCLNFAMKTVGTHREKYASRGQTSLMKIITDITYGKMCEMAVFERFPQLGCPDFALYDEQQKSFDADFTYNGKNYHVKSCKDSPSPSWVFQKEDPLVTNPTEKDVLILCTRQDADVEFIFCPAPWVKYEFRPPRNSYLAHTKTCLYLTDVERVYALVEEMEV